MRCAQGILHRTLLTLVTVGGASCGEPDREVIGSLTRADTGAAGWDANGTDTLYVPLRWCAIEGSPVVTSPPGGPSPANTSAVLVARMDNATNSTWAAGANIIFRSAVPASAGAVPFPIIPDPRPPLAGGTGSQLGQLGDIDHCAGGTAASCELTAALESCKAAWTALGSAQSPAITIPQGPIVLHVRNLVKTGAAPTGGTPSALGTSSWQQWRTGSVCRADWVVNNSNYNQGTYAVVTDKQVNADAADRTLAHELGHALFLAHGNGIDDDGDGYADACDGSWSSSDTAGTLNPSAPRESTNLQTPNSLMTSGANTLPRTLTASQRFVARTTGYGMPGRTWDPPMVLVQDDRARATQTDPSGDIADPSADLVAVEISADPADATTRVGFGLAGAIPQRGTYRYGAFVDLDNDRGTGGPPPALGFPGSNRLSGIDLVVVVDVKSGSPDLRVWGLRGRQFVRLHDAGIRVELTESGRQDEGSDATALRTDGILVHIPNAACGVKLASVARLQAYAGGSGCSGTDSLPDAGTGATLSVAPARMAGAFLDRTQARPGERVTLIATDLVPGAQAKVFLGGTPVGEGTVDGSGNLSGFVFTVPWGAVPGVQLVSVRVGTVTTGATLDVLCRR